MIASYWGLIIPLALYTLALAFNIPWRLLLANTATIAIFLAMFLVAPPASIWVYILLIIACHYLQQWSHRIYRKESSMAEFAAKYKKGARLFVLLSIYELPILLNYLVFDRSSWQS